MKRGTFALVGLIAALVLPVGATGATSESDTTAQAQRGTQDLRIRFRLKSEDGEPTELRRFRFAHLLANCDELVQVYVEGRIGRLPVNRRNHFSETAREPGKKVQVKGRVSNDLKRVVGRIRAEGDFSGGRNCDSGWVRWRAR